MLCLSWGFNQIAIKVAVTEIAPMIQGAIRSVGGLAVILAWCRLRRIPLTDRDGTLRAGIALGISSGIEFVLIYQGLALTTASRGALFLYTHPFFVALGIRVLGERLTGVHWLGLAFSFVGVALAFGVPGAVSDPRMLIGDLMMVGAGALWGLNSLILKGSALRSAPAEKVLCYELVVSAPLLATASLLAAESLNTAPSALAAWCLAFQIVWVVGVTYTLWRVLLQRYSVSRLSAFTFLTPLFGIAAGHLLLGDPLEPSFAVAAALVVGGLVLVNRPTR